MHGLDTKPFTILISALIEGAIRIPLKAYAIFFVICIAAFVNVPILVSVLSYSMSLIFVYLALVFVSVSVDDDSSDLGILFPFSWEGQSFVIIIALYYIGVICFYFVQFF